MFRAGQAENIFDVVQDFPPEKTVVVIDPPRKGCDDKFIEQLLTFGPQTVVYVSCNVHTQARDVGRIMKTGGYRLESVRGFDLFPQTAHVESVSVLRACMMNRQVSRGLTNDVSGRGASKDVIPVDRGR